MREMSFNQLSEAIQENEWMVTIYGMEKEEVRAAPSTPSYRPRTIPAQPALPPREDDSQLVPAGDAPASPLEPMGMLKPRHLQHLSSLNDLLMLVTMNLQSNLYTRNLMFMDVLALLPWSPATTSNAFWNAFRSW